ncbi:MAG: ATP-grasp domain-containing protein [Planctomycetales bacterium]|nr:ATP-grasp domain-containing protein [Planctomycetales bacterium]
MNSQKTIALVDPFSSGSQLAHAAAARGFDSWMVQSTREIPPMYRSSYFPQHFKNTIIFDGDFESICNSLRAENIQCVVAGCESGVELSDHISEYMGLISNGTQLTQARRNKLLMSEVLRSSQISIPETRSFKDWLHVEKYLLQRSYPVVIKPLRSSGSDGVHLCTDLTTARTAFNKIIGQPDVYGYINREVLIQEFVSGTEFAVDTVSRDGQHQVAAFWRYHKTLDQRTYVGCDAMELLPYCPSLHRSLFPYICRVLDALGIRHGPAHCEVVNSSNGPVIIEVGARLNGGNNPLLSSYCGGRSQIELTLDAYLDATNFLLQIDRPYETLRHAIRVMLIPPTPGRLKSLPNFDYLQKLESFLQYRFSAMPGQRLSRVAGWVVLVHADREVIESDMQRIRSFEADGLFETEPESTD